MSSSQPTYQPGRSGSGNGGPGGALNQKKDDLSAQGGNTPAIHQTVERIPRLDSAPPSGNNLSKAVSDDPLSSMLLPPPPPPPSRAGVTVDTSTTTTTPTNTAKATPPSRFGLPPPPRVTRPASTSTTARSVPPLPPPPPGVAVTATTAGILPVSVRPPPPPPPPPPPLPVPAQSAKQEPSPPAQLSQQLPIGTGPPPFLPVTTFASPPSSKERAILARRQTHVPVLIIATEAANQLAWKNGLQLSDLFQGIVEESKPSLQTMTPFRSVNRSLFLKDVRVRFVTPDQFDPLNADDTMTLLNDHAALQDEDGDIDQDLILLEDRIDELLQEQKSSVEEKKGETLEEISKEAFRLTSPLDSMPWLIRYRQALDRSTDGLPHDSINCPPLVLLVCTATKEITAPENVLRELYQSNHVLPDVYRRGLYDPSAVRREVLVLHDNQDGDNNALDEKGLRQLLRSRFGNNASLLRVNSTSYDTAAVLAEEETSDPWGGKGKLGTFLSDNDRALFRRYFQSLLTTVLLPSLERRIADMNAIVSERKKGMRNLVKSFWRKPKDDTTSSSSTNSVHGQSSSSKLSGGDGDEEVAYRYDSIESQTHLLADTLFLMEDYDNALSTYRLIRDDYKSDKALVHYGNVLEMIALCMFQLDPHTRPREIFSVIEQALVSYTRAAEEERIRMAAMAKQLSEPNVRNSTTKSYITRLATRLSLVLAMSASTVARGRSLECADLLASVSSYESSLGAAVLMEQSSVFFYRAHMSRKYAFHMLMGGHMFQKSGQHHHAFRCFASAMYIYRNEMWGKLYNHLKTALAAQLYTMGRMSIALILYAKLVGENGGGKVSVQSQQKFLHNLVDICENHTKAALAGADRMAVPANVPRKRREIYRNERLEQVVKVIQYTKGASRVLELPNVNLPNIADSSVRLWTKSESGAPNKPKGSSWEDSLTEIANPSKTECPLGEPGKGDEKVWEELELMTVAEVNTAGIVDNISNSSPEETITAALAKIENLQHRRFIAEIDKEKQNISLAERSKRKNQKSLPVVRSRAEPIFCDFQMKNPLGVEVNITEIQLVARMVHKSKGKKKMCTNEFAIQINDKTVSQSEWKFASTALLQFQVPHFCRISEPNVKSCTSAQANPFFVVTKQSVNIPAEGKILVSAGITPLIKGDLEILGVRCKLQDKVWLYHAFDIPGPLLKDTRTNIMNKVRGKSTYLKTKIEGYMPSLTAELITRLPADSPTVAMDDGPMLEGQISTWTLRLRNVGTAPASNVVLKTNLPWIDIVESENNSYNSITAEEKESKAVSHCIGPSGTLMALPVGDSIDPNDIVDLKIKIRVRTSGEQKQDFYMLYKYDLFEKSAEKEPKNCSRWLRNMYQVPVFPSLSFKAKPVATTWKGKDILVSVELKNDRLDRPTDLYITLDRLSLMSRRYCLEALPGQFTRSKEFGDVLQIGWQEQVTVFYRVLLKEEESSSTSCKLSECPFSETGGTIIKECASSSETNYLCLENAFVSFQSAWNSHQEEVMRIENTPDSEKEHPRSIASIRRANTPEVRNVSSKRVNHPTSIGSMCPPSLSSNACANANASEIHLTCSWRAILGQEVVRGEHYLRGIPIVPKAFFNGCPIAAKAEHATTTEHDFSQRSSVIVPLTLTLTNRMLETPVRFTWAWDSRASWKSPRSSSLELNGACAQTLTLEPSQEAELPLEVLVTEAGVHDLANLRFVVHRGTKSETEDEDETYRLSQQWLIHLVDTSSSSSSRTYTTTTPSPLE